MSGNPVFSRRQRSERKAFSQTTELEKGLEDAVEKSVRAVQEKLDKLLKDKAKELNDSNA
jgi:hypothetical protein